MRPVARARLSGPHAHSSLADRARHRLYSPAAWEIAESLRLVEAFDAAVARGHASVLFEGRMIDVAMAKAARNVIAWAQAHGVT